MNELSENLDSISLASFTCCAVELVALINVNRVSAVAYNLASLKIMKTWINQLKLTEIFNIHGCRHKNPSSNFRQRKRPLGELKQKY